MPALLAYAAVADSAAAFVKTLVSAAAAVTVQIGTKATPSLRLPLCSVINTAFHLPVTNTFLKFRVAASFTTLPDVFCFEIDEMAEKDLLKFDLWRPMVPPSIAKPQP